MPQLLEPGRAGVCRCVHLNSESPWSSPVKNIECGFFKFQKSWASPRTMLSTRKCMLENWLSLGS